MNFVDCDMKVDVICIVVCCIDVLMFVKFKFGVNLLFDFLESFWGRMFVGVERDD